MRIDKYENYVCIDFNGDMILTRNEFGISITDSAKVQEKSKSIPMTVNGCAVYIVSKGIIRKLSATISVLKFIWLGRAWL